MTNIFINFHLVFPPACNFERWMIMETHMADWHPHDRNMEADVVWVINVPYRFVHLDTCSSVGDTFGEAMKPLTRWSLDGGSIPLGDVIHKFITQWPFLLSLPPPLSVLPVGGWHLINQLPAPMAVLPFTFAIPSPPRWTSLFWLYKSK